jgi:MFS family permease
MPSFRVVLGRFFVTRSSRQVRELTLSVAVMNFAVAAIALFEPIYLYTLGFGLRSILLYNAAIFGLLFFLYPLGAKLSGRLGLRHAILLSSPFQIAYYLFLFAVRENSHFLVGAVLAAVLHTALYWPNFHSELARHGAEGERGKELSNLVGIMSLSAVLGPVFGGFLAAWAGFPALFLAAAVLILLSNIPLLKLPEEGKGDGFSYTDAFRRLAAPENRRRASTFLGFGEDLVGLVVWPVFVYVAFRDTSVTGLVVSASVLVTTLAMLFIGRLSDLQSRHAVQRTGVIFLCAAWIARAFVRTGAGVFGADVFYRISSSTTWIPTASMLYADAKKKTNPLDTIILFEMSLAVGKFAACLIGIVLLTIFPGSFSALFVMAALFSLFFALYP